MSLNSRECKLGMLWELLFLFFISLADAKVFQKTAGPRGAIRLTPYKGNSNFDEFMLTRIYPLAVCRADDDTVPDSCEIPADSPMWTVHGLWPERSDGSYPQFCDGHPRKFDPDLIASIEEDLKKTWPNLYPSKPVHSFWKHEYEKHGTCAQAVKSLETELEYFKSTITLNNKFSVDEALKRGGIVPGEKKVKKTEVQEVLNKELAQGHYVQFNCLTDKKTKQTLLADVRMCTDLDFNPIDCPKERSDIPVTEILGEAVPLPTFKTCPDEFIYLFEDKPLTEVELVKEKPEDKLPTGLLFFLNPFLQVIPKLIQGCLNWWVFLSLLLLAFCFKLMVQADVAQHRLLV